VQETLASLGPGIAYSRLLRLRTGPEGELPQPSLLLECELCKSWQMLDSLTYRFQLREGIRWQDIPPVSGRELIAQDVVFSYKRQSTPGWANAPLLQNIRAIESEGRYTLKITLSPGFPDADFLISLADGHTKVVAEEAVGVKGHLREGPVIGSGPWIWKSTQDDVGSVFVKNPTYFEKALPFLDELTIRVIKGGEESRLAAFVTKQVDVYRVSPDAWRQLNQADRQFNFLSRQGGAGLILTMNVSAPPFNNLQVRKAVLKALDPWEYVDTIWAGQGLVSLGMPVESSDWLLTRDEMKGAYFDNLSEARSLLSGLGLPAPVKFDLTVADFGDIYIRQGRRIEEDLRSAGFDPIFKVLNPTQYAETVWRDRSYQLSVGQLPPTSTTNSFLFAILHGTQGRWNILAHSDRRLDEMIVNQAVESSSTRRKELVREIQRYLLEQAYLFSPVTGPVAEGARWVFGPRLKGFYPNIAASEYFFWAKTWLESAQGAHLGAPLLARPVPVLLYSLFQSNPGEKGALDAHGELAHGLKGLQVAQLDKLLMGRGASEHYLPEGF